MATSAYEDILRGIQDLSPADQLRLLDELPAIVQHQNEPQHSILELRGLGKEVWEGIDAQEYVNQERDAWGG